MTPISSRLRRSAFAMQPINTSPVELPASVPQDSSLWARQGDRRPRSRSGRPGRSPLRPLLRTAFRSFSGLATVVVGGQRDNGSHAAVTYLVHKELLTAASPFFAAALNSTFAEGLDQRVRLPEEKPEIFEWFLQWLYTGALTTQPTWSEPATPRGRSNNHTHAAAPSLPTYHLATDAAYPLGAAQQQQQLLDGDLRNLAGSPKYFLLLDIYALADRLLVTPLSNHVLSTMARLSDATNSVPTPSDTWILYGGTIDSQAEVEQPQQRQHQKPAPSSSKAYEAKASADDGKANNSNDTDYGNITGDDNDAVTSPGRPPLSAAAGLREDSPARALVLDLFAYKKTDRLLATHRDEWHPRFLRDLAVKLKRPGAEALERHALVAWRPRSWSQTRGCEGCREPLRPAAAMAGGAGSEGAGVGRRTAGGGGNISSASSHYYGGGGNSSGDKCAECGKVFCNDCLRRHAVDPAFVWPHDPTGCKPWAGPGMCWRYHEHADGESCG